MSGRLSRLQCAMLTSNKIPGLLGVNVKEVDFQVSFQYEITGKRMLSELLRTEGLSCAQFYGLLLQIVAVLNDSKKYMLKASGLLLETSCMFVEGSLSAGAVYCTYIPVTDYPANEGAKSFLDLIMHLVPYVTGLEGEGLQQIITLCSKSEHFSFSLLNHLLLDLLEQEGSGMEGRIGESSMTGPNRLVHELDGHYGNPAGTGTGEVRSDLRGLQPQAHPESREPLIKTRSGRLTSRHDSTAKEFGSAAAIRKSESEPGEKPVLMAQKGAGRDEQDHTAHAMPNRTYIVLAAVLITALGWKLLYLDRPGSEGLLGAAALTAVSFVAATLLIARGKRRMVEKETASGEQEGNRFGANESKLSGSYVPLIQQADRTLDGGNQGKSLFAHPDTGFRVQHTVNSRPDDLAGLLDARPIAARSHASYEETAAALPILEKGFANKAANSGFQVQETAAETTNEAKRPGPAPRYATVLLNKTEAESAGQSERFGFLQRLEGSGSPPQQIELTPGSFVIGRSADVVQFVETTAGASRAHIEVLVNHNRWQIKDLGSRNGTRLNGEEMVPYKAYTLAPGDEFSIAGAHYKLFA